jgi:CO/xanthine dehydrogenase FAD-binding subunit
MQEFEFLSASSVEEVARFLAENKGRLIAGGTDVLPQLQRGTIHSDVFVDITRLDELRFIRERQGWVEIGALTIYAELLESDYLQRVAPSLVEAAATVGCPQTRNRGTIGGNIANASPAGDTLPPLLTYEARAHVIRNGKKEIIPLGDLFTGPGETILTREDLLHSVLFKPLREDEECMYLKLGNRKGMNIAVASVALKIRFSSPNRIKEAWVALGSVAPTPVRGPSAEKVLKGAKVSEEVMERTAQAVREDISPITDVRASAARRDEAAAVLLKRALRAVVERRMKP